MELAISTKKPEWANASGKTYETKFLYTGLGRVDTTTMKYQKFQTGTDFFMFEEPFAGGVVSRVYMSEFATITEYSKMPRRWKEETPAGTHYFSELRRISH